MIEVESVSVDLNPEFLRSVEAQSKDLAIRQGQDLAEQLSGSLMKRGKPSLPGETPTVWNEDLKDIVVTYDAQNKAVLVYPRRHGSDDVPAQLEFGTSTMEPRPYMRPTFERNISKIINGWRNAIK